MLLARASSTSRQLLHTARIYRRWQSTLEQNPYIYVFPHPDTPSSTPTNLLTLLPTTPPNPALAIATTTALPPTPENLTENPHFMDLLQTVVSEHATADPAVQSQAAAFASTSGSNLGSGGIFFPSQQQQAQQQPQHRQTQRRALRQQQQQRGDGAGGASAQGGAGGGGVGGWVHVADQRNPPDWGRVAYPEDILGSVQVDGTGAFVGDRGGYQSSGTYRVVTREGILGLSPFLREKLTARLREIEVQLQQQQQQHR